MSISTKIFPALVGVALLATPLLAGAQSAPPPPPDAQTAPAPKPAPTKPLPATGLPTVKVNNTGAEPAPLKTVGAPTPAATSSVTTTNSATTNDTAGGGLPSYAYLGIASLVLLIIAGGLMLAKRRKEAAPLA